MDLFQSKRMHSWTVDQMLRKDIAKRLNLEDSQQQLIVTSALSKSGKIDSAIVSVNASS